MARLKGKIMAKLQLADVPIVDYGEAEEAMVAYRAEGEALAARLGNRGPVRFGPDGKLDRSIIDAYTEHGFYIFSGVLGPDERADIEADLADMLDRSPITKGAATDRHGRPALGVGLQGRNVTWVRPLSDPIGGTDAAHGRHPAKMFEPRPPDEAPDWVIQLFLGSLQFSEACLRVYGHPDLLRVAESINGPDFTPFNEAVWLKQPGLGGSVAWHQDGWTHWDSPELDPHTHGFNFMGQLYGCNSVNGLWVLPGSHRQGKLDIKALVEAAGSDRLPGAVPLLCEPGDVAMTSRQAVHGSFANTCSELRVTINFGFHRRSSILGVTSGGVHNDVAVYDEERIHQRSKAIMWAIDARAQRFPREPRYVYQPFAGEEDRYRWGPDAALQLRDYNLLDLGI
jgi:hypothetical protein